MSLDFYVHVPEYRAYVRRNGKTEAMAFENEECECKHVGNITHNLKVMAEHVPVSDTLTLYNVLWRPDESGLNTTDDILEYVTTGVKYMIDHKEDLLQYNPDNGWGDYDELLDFAKRVGSACLFNPNCKIEANR